MGAGNRPSLLSLTVGELLDAVAEPGPAPGGGAVAALAVALAAGLAEKAARAGGRLEEAERAASVRAGVTPLADADAAGHENFQRALGMSGDDPARAKAIRRARADAVGVPSAVADAAVTVAALAAALGADEKADPRGDATAAALLASAAAEAARAAAMRAGE